jgi:LPS-assembly protein
MSASLMRKSIALLLFLAMALPCLCLAQEPPGFNYKSLDQVIPGAPHGNIDYDFASQNVHATYTLLQYQGATLTADNITLNQQTYVANADGNVRIEYGGEIWIGNHITYNFKTHQIETGQFRTGKAPFFAQGDKISGGGTKTNQLYTADRVYSTADNVNRPSYYVRASQMKLVPGKYIEARNAVLYVEGVPMFYYPYYRRNLQEHANTLTVMPGDESMYGPFLLGTYTWWLNKYVDGKVHVDYREKRGPGAGPDLNLHLGRLGDAQFEYYYTRDHDTGESVSSNAFDNLGTIPKDRQRFYMGWQATPYTNIETKALVNYQSDDLVLHDFFQSDWGENPQPNTFVEGTKYWNDWSLDADTTPRINDFFDQVERLPEAKLTGYRQEIFNTPLYYESQSSVGYYERYFAGTNTIFGATNNTPQDYDAARADTYQQLLIPETFFGWLNVTPRAGERVTWYGPGNGAGGTNSQVTRAVFNTGVDTSFTLSQLWPDVKNSTLDVDGLRHIIVPSLSYVYVSTPNVNAAKVPQFDTQLPSLLILPIEYPDNNNIDAIESENTIRFGIRNTLQTERDNKLDDLLNWSVMLDWNLRPNGQTNVVFLQPQKTFDDLYSDLAFKPRSWITFESQVRYDINDNHLNLAFHQVSFTPNDRWSLGLGHWYLHNGFIDSGDDVITGSIFYRLDDNWGLRTMHYFNAETGHLQEQDYSIYRDMRSFTTALTFRVLDNGNGQKVDYGFAFSISLKAFPRYHVGDDTVRPYELLSE